MKAWLANLMWDALVLVLARAHDWAFDPVRAAKTRMKNRERWWAYKLAADQTRDPHDNLRAQWWATVFGFETPPAKAIDRGDLDPHARKLAMDAVERARLHP